MKAVFTGFLLKQVIVCVMVMQSERVSNDHCRNILLKYYNNAIHVLYKTQEMWFSRSASKDDGGKVARTVCMVFIPNVVMAKLLAHVSITHDNNNCFGSLYQYFSF